MSETPEPYNQSEKQLQKENETLKRENTRLNTESEQQSVRIKQLEEQLAKRNADVSGYSGTLDALTEEFAFLTKRLHNLLENMTK